MSTRRLNGAAFRALREAYKIPQGEMAARLEIHPGYLSNLEKGAKQPAPVLLHKMADQLGLSVDAISHVVPELATA